MRIMIADTQAEVRAALRLLLEEAAGLQVVGEAAEAEMLLAQAGLVCPDLVLLDWGLPGLRIAALLPALRLLCPQVQIIALSGRPEARQAALAIGVDSFISKGALPEQVVMMVRAMMPRAYDPPTMPNAPTIPEPGRQNPLTT